MNEFDQPTLETKSTQKTKNNLIIIVIVVVFIGSVVGAFYLGKSLPAVQSNSQSSSKTDGERSKAWEKLASSEKAFPIQTYKDKNSPGVWKLYSLSKNKLLSLDTVELTPNGGSYAGSGSSDPIASPNLLYTAFVGKDSNLWLLSNETLQTQQLTTTGFVGSIIGWSPDSTKITFNHAQDTIANRTNVPHAPTTSKLSFKPQSDVGLHQISVETGDTTPLAAIEYSDGYINNDTLLVRPDSDSASRLIVFNTKTLEADQSSIKLQPNFGTNQFSFSRDGKKWAYLNSLDPQQPTEGGVTIVFGSFPQTASTVIETGSWAELQWPRFSPNGTKIVYQKSEGYIGEGVPKETVWIYDIAKKTKAKYAEGAPERWLDDSTILVKPQGKDGFSLSSFILLDINTKKATTVKTS